MKLKYLLPILILTIIAAVLRIYNLDLNSLWLDEAATIEYSSKGFMMAWTYFAAGEYNPPLFYWITGFMMNFGNSEFILRLAPAIFGIIAIPLTYLLGKEWKDENTGLAAAALLTFSPWHLYYSQEARTYSLSVALAILLMLFYLKALKDNSYKNWIIVGVIAAIGCWAHLYFAILVLTLFVHALMIYIDFKHPIKSLAKPLVGITTYIWIALPVILVVFFGLWSRRTAQAPTYGIKGFAVITDFFWNFGSYIQWVSILFFLLLVAGIYLTYRDDEQNKTKNVLLVLTFIIIPLIITIPLSYIVPMVTRYLIFLLPFILIIMVQPLLFLKDRRLQALLVCAVIAFGVPTLTIQETQFTKDDFRGYIKYLDTITQPGDTVIAVPEYIDLPIKYYYNNTTRGTFFYGGSNVSQILGHTNTSPGARNWYILTPDVNAADPSGKAHAWLDANTEKYNQYPFYIYTSFKQY
jgi:mannosyltransferase